ncbi:AraC family transcriptional regulator [Paenibacillus lutimineralis]|uniref:DNA-binding response regulator n=1 Tax=Paenibacillus lutimineralis TaxID=2707005 RepID=A0A3S9UT06_9BACL|nr:AraC family transcriptional regulator [Paenibacillus lutimineralis]AZS13394.1 DNA-binding response regulator [Paenibacillus lutimineralis]
MYRLLITDDEALEREGIEWIATRMMPGTFEIAHAENGRMAIQKAAEFHPHIVMMDVRMPGIQGLDALKEIKAQNPDVKMVMITAYEYFDYAKQAISLGVREYLVKPAKRAEVAAVLERLVQEIEAERHKRNEQLAVRDKFYQLLPLAETEIALHLMADQVNETEVEQLADILSLSIERGCALVLAFSELGDKKKRVYEEVKNLAHALIKEPYSVTISSLVYQHMAIFLLGDPQGGSASIGEEAALLAGKLAEGLSQQCDIMISVGIGSVQTGIPGIKQSYYEAVFVSKYDQWGDINRFEDLNFAEPERPGKNEDKLTPTIRSVGENSYVDLAIRQIREEREQSTHNMLDQAVAYIHRKYQEDLSLEDAAEHVHLNPYYFSKLFKQQTGETFIDYVTRLRIEKAKEMMKDSHLSLKEVCYAVGYKDPNYFSRVFKKVTGVTPSEYRQQLR